MATAETIHRQLVEAWNTRDFDAMRELLHTEYTYTSGDGKELAGGPDTGLNIAKTYAAAFPDGRIEVRATYAHGETAISELRATGTHGGELMGIPPTGKPVELVICNVIELRDGKIYREREYFDVAAMLAQIGVVLSPAQT
jgi:steroid delta-isomerase-like uncharacterized protein